MVRASFRSARLAQQCADGAAFRVAEVAQVQDSRDLERNAMTTPHGGRLTRHDEWPRHQVARTFDSVATDSPHWSDGYYFTASDAAGTASVYTAIRLYANNDVMDGYACVGIDGRQHNVRWSRRLRPAIDDLAVGPLRVDVLAPLEQLRTTCAPNDYGIAYDLTWTGLHEPYLEAYAERWAAGRLTA
jgi:hypothetical protein